MERAPAFSDRELGTILAALRYWQRCGEFGGDDINQIATNGGEFKELDGDEIDNLCERLNIREAHPTLDSPK